MNPTAWPPAYPSDYLPPAEQEHWSPELETMSPEERDTILLAKLRNQVHYAYRTPASTASSTATRQWTLKT